MVKMVMVRKTVADGTQATRAPLYISTYLLCSFVPQGLTYYVTCALLLFSSCVHVEFAYMAGMLFVPILALIPTLVPFLVLHGEIGEPRDELQCRLE